MPPKGQTTKDATGNAPWSKYKNHRIDCMVQPRMKQNLIAISFYRGQKGEHSSIVREFLEEGIQRYIDALPGPERAKFDYVLRMIQGSHDLKGN